MPKLTGGALFARRLKKARKKAPLCNPSLWFYEVETFWSFSQPSVFSHEDFMEKEARWIERFNDGGNGRVPKRIAIKRNDICLLDHIIRRHYYIQDELPGEESLVAILEKYISLIKENGDILPLPTGAMRSEKLLELFKKHGALPVSGNLMDYLIQCHNRDANMQILYELGYTPNHKDLKEASRDVYLANWITHHGFDWEPDSSHQYLLAFCQQKCWHDPNGTSEARLDYERKCVRAMLEGGSDPGEITRCSALWERCRTDLLGMMYEYGAPPIHLPFAESYPCIHWCDIPPSWEIQRLLWIAHLKEEEDQRCFMRLLPMELIVLIIRYCGITHITLSERARIRRSSSS